MNFKNLLTLLLTVPFIIACNNEDDINAIFCSGTWQLNNFYITSQWNKQNITDSRLQYENMNEKDLAEVQSFSIKFSEDGSFTAIANNSNIQGTWSADGKSRKVSVSYTGQPSGTTWAKRYFEALKNAKYYKGTNGFLQLAPQETNSFIQFKH
jgi:hypothetical protein